jgi:poly(3-hydroxyalkanoate) synthetase
LPFDTRAIKSWNLVNTGSLPCFPKTPKIPKLLNILKTLTYTNTPKYQQPNTGVISWLKKEGLACYLIRGTNPDEELKDWWTQERYA